MGSTRPQDTGLIRSAFQSPHPHCWSMMNSVQTAEISSTAYNIQIIHFHWQNLSNHIKIWACWIFFFYLFQYSQMEVIKKCLLLCIPSHIECCHSHSTYFKILLAKMHCQIWTEIVDLVMAQMFLKSWKMFLGGKFQNFQTFCHNCASGSAIWFLFIYEIEIYQTFQHAKSYPHTTFGWRARWKFFFLPYVGHIFFTSCPAPISYAAFCLPLHCC